MTARPRSTTARHSQHEWRLTDALPSAVLFTLLGALTIGRRGFWLDEAYTWGIVQQPSFGDFVAAIGHSAGNNFGYLLVLRLWSVGGDGEIWMRLPSLLFAFGTVILVQPMAARAYSVATSRLVGLLAAASVPVLFYGVEARGYAMLMFFVTLAVALSMRAIERDRPQDWVWLGVAALLAVSAHIIAMLSLPLFGIYALWRFGLIAAAIRLVPVGAAGLIGIGVTAVSPARDASFPPPLSPIVVAKSGRLLLGDHGVFTKDGIGFVLAGLTAVLLVVALLRFLRSQRRDVDWWIWIWLVTPPALTLIVSVVEPVLWHRMLIGSLPPVFLVLGDLLASISRRRLAAALLVVLVAGGAARSWIISSDDLWEFEALHQTLEDQAQPGDLVLFVHPWERAGLDYYMRNGAGDLSAVPPFGPRDSWGTIATNQAAIGIVSGGQRLWLIDGADAAQVWRNDARTDDDFDFSEPDVGNLTLVEQFDVGRFRARLYQS